jgi:tRNA(His) 5'-end guanylyltransferase
MKDDLGDRMKRNFEDRTRYMLPRRTYAIIRLDGKSFHTYTKGLDKPFDEGLMEDTDNAIIAMLPQVQGAVFAYTQSDEISILLTDFNEVNTSAWFDGNIQKITSVASSILTAEFNKLRFKRWIGLGEISVPALFGVDEPSLATFDARVFTIPDRTEVMNYFIWRNQDCSRNSISMVAQYHFSHKQLQGKTTKDKLQMLKDKGVDYDNYYSLGERYGRIIDKEIYYLPPHKFKKVSETPMTEVLIAQPVQRTRWVANGAWKFTDDKVKLLHMIPTYEN